MEEMALSGWMMYLRLIIMQQGFSSVGYLWKIETKRGIKTTKLSDWERNGRNMFKNMCERVTKDKKKVISSQIRV